MDTAKLFWSGRSQAIRLPKQYRLDVEEVRIRRHGNTLVLEPVMENWQWLDALAGQLDEDFVQEALAQPEQQARPDLDGLFR